MLAIWAFSACSRIESKQESNLVAKTLVYNELVSRGYQVYIGKDVQGGG